MANVSYSKVNFQDFCSRRTSTESHKESLRVNVLFEYIQKMLSCDTVVVAETCDS
ncbi:pyruvate decarboxylase [Artemisia annua]|uniref:Pyruvate decarboxylase n=1 Tax=Artemisia annua TaxID=35608 RepID=A0A2U1NJH5_ARTAN|nr:pyruvate decarboxylase [Artemisia annua]